MSELVENTVDTTDDTDLDAFSAMFHSNEPEPVKDAEVDESDADLEDHGSDEPTADEADVLEEDDTTEADDLADPEPKEPKAPKKNRAQERIEQLLEKERLANEKAASLEARIKELEAKGQEPEKAKPEPKTEDKAPHWDDLNEDGTEKYPLGQFDPQFAEDHIRFLMDKRMAEAEAKEAEAREAAKSREAQEAAQKEWETKLGPAQERYPDFQQKGAELVDALTEVGLDQGFGDYLTNVILSMEHGPDVLYYLGSNIEEAKNIVDMGPLGATLALGRIEASFTKPKVEKRQTKAPPPPPANKGNNAAVPEVPDDTDDLEAFEAKFFKRA